MNCPEVMELMQRYVDHDLDQAEEALLLAHVMQCPECADMLEKLQLLSDELESLPEVMPPFSIVDSILPQLERMANEQNAAESGDSGKGAMLTAGERNALLGPPPGAQDAAAENAASKESRSAGISRDRRAEKPPKVRWFSWKWAGGAAAAAVVIGVFLFQQKPLSHQNADSLAEKSEQVRAMGASGGAANRNEAADANSNKVKEQGALSQGYSNEKSDAQATEAPRMASSASPKPSEAVKSQPPASAKPGAVVKTLSPSPPDAAKSIQPSPTPKPTTGTETPKPSNTQSGSGMAGGTADRGGESAGVLEKTDNSDKAPSFIVQPPPLSGTVSDTAPTSTPAITAETSDNEKMEIKGDNHKSGLTAGSADELNSPNQTYKAKISGQHVVVLDKDGNTVAESPEWVDAKSIRLEGWEGTSLKYVVVMQDDSERLQVIDFGGRKIVP